MIQKAKLCYLFSPAYIEFEFPEKETAWAFPASLFLQTTDDQLWWGRCGLLCCFWLFATRFCQSLGGTLLSFVLAFSLLNGEQKVFCSCDSSPWWIFLNSAGYREAGSFFRFILYLNSLPPEAHLCLTCPDAISLGILLLWQLLPRAQTENEFNRWN